MARRGGDFAERRLAQVSAEFSLGAARDCGLVEKYSISMQSQCEPYWAALKVKINALGGGRGMCQSLVLLKGLGSAWPPVISHAWRQHEESPTQMDFMPCDRRAIATQR